VQDIPQGVPVVFVSGSADRHAHLDEVTAMYRLVESHATLVVFDGAQHVNLDRYDPQLYRTALFHFLQRQQPAAAGPAGRRPVLNAPLRAVQ
jgi:hypothetical protein